MLTNLHSHVALLSVLNLKSQANLYTCLILSLVALIVSTESWIGELAIDFFYDLVFLGGHNVAPFNPQPQFESLSMSMYLPLLYSHLYALGNLLLYFCALSAHLLTVPDFSDQILHCYLS